MCSATFLDIPPTPCGTPPASPTAQNKVFKSMLLIMRFIQRSRVRVKVQRASPLTTYRGSPGIHPRHKWVKNEGALKKPPHCIVLRSVKWTWSSTASAQVYMLCFLVFFKHFLLADVRRLIYSQSVSHSSFSTSLPYPFLKDCSASIYRLN